MAIVHSSSLCHSLWKSCWRSVVFCFNLGLSCCPAVMSTVDRLGRTILSCDTSDSRLFVPLFFPFIRQSHLWTSEEQRVSIVSAALTLLFLWAYPLTALLHSHGSHTPLTEPIWQVAVTGDWPLSRSVGRSHCCVWWRREWMSSCQILVSLGLGAQLLVYWLTTINNWDSFSTFVFSFIYLPYFNHREGRRSRVSLEVLTVTHPMKNDTLSFWWLSILATSSGTICLSLSQSSSPSKSANCLTE